MCLATPAKIISIKNKMAEVDDGHAKKKVYLVLIKNPKIGEYLLVHTNLAISKIDKKEAEEIINLISQHAAKCQGRFVGKVAAPPH
ncbi:MAG: HypC/HybG/HupF family hydrogenase formation chaperone [Candidatus Berkelbacteria bacterium]|nr:HypC/HybG/HupF family hydrogenase formation chaperone [Candidatus Berkelbacteria bacterium]